MAELFDYLNAITNKKNPTVMEDDPYAEKDYDPYVINKFLSQKLDCIYDANEMNYRPFADKKMQFDYLINSIRKKFRKAEKWLKPESNGDLKYVQEYFNYNKKRASEALMLLTDDDIKMIKYSLRKGGEKDDRKYD